MLCCEQVENGGWSMDLTEFLRKSAKERDVEFTNAYEAALKAMDVEPGTITTKAIPYFPSSVLIFSVQGEHSWGLLSIPKVCHLQTG